MPNKDEQWAPTKNRNFWMKLVPASMLVIAAAGAGVSKVVEDIHGVVSQAPLEAHRVDKLEQDVAQLKEQFALLTSALSELTYQVKRLADRLESQEVTRNEG